MIDDSGDEETIQHAATAAGFGHFVPHYVAEIQMGLPPVVGVESYALYDYIRAFTYFGTPKRPGTLLGKLATMRDRDGKLGAWLSYARLSEAFEWSVSTVNRHLVPLRELGWLEPIEIDRSLRAWAYVVGEYTRNTKGDYSPQFYREATTEALFKAMKKHAFEVREHASIFALTPGERIEFTKQWVAARRVKARAKAAA